MAEQKYHFYMKKAINNGDGTYSYGKELDIEEQFPGLRYKKCTGLNNIGKQSTYTESFSDEQRTLAYVPADAVSAPTNITMTLLFFGKKMKGDEVDNINDIYMSFMDLVRGGEIIYHDTFRKRWVRMILTSESSPSVDRILGLAYREVTLTFMNIFGKSFDSEAGLIY